MIQAEIKRDIQHSYLVIKEASDRENTYQERMLLFNKLDGFLPFRVQCMNGERVLYYELQGYQSLKEVVSKIPPGVSQLRNLVQQLIHIMSEMKEYLLKEEDIVLSMEYMFVRLPDYSPYLCYHSGYHQPIRKQLSEFIEMLMESIDYKDKEAVYFLYTLYMKSRDQDCTIRDLENLLEGETKEAPEEVKRSDPQEIESISPLQQIGVPAAVEALFVPPNQPTGTIKEEKIKPVHKHQRPLVSNQKCEEQEITYYPLKIYTAAGGLTIAAILLCIFLLSKGTLRDPVTGDLEPIKLIMMFVVISLPLAYALTKLFHSSHRVSKIVETELFEPIVQEETAASIEIPVIVPPKGSAVSEPRKAKTKENPMVNCMDGCKTILLNGVEVAPFPQLIPENTNLAETMTITECPYFIGTVKNKMNYSLISSVISRYHAKIEEIEGAYYVSDLGSTNGTFVNGKRIPPNEPSILVPGDKIAFANICFIYTCPNI